MPNFNDAEITDIFVSQVTTPAVEDDAPNAPNGGPYDVTVEMVAGTGVQTEEYTLLISCADITTMAPAPGLVPTGPAFANPGKFGASAGWTPGAQFATFAATATVGPGTSGNVYQYTASLLSANGQVVSIRQSDLFVLI
ncbi:hypothetical protein [Trebonia sp.]|uniref:hypothetical protein n=1 Tax=Trebonia sp. TaxID=2767075 RepID=UPI002625DC3F|nr:hypothetical protein [Trebonia sp.]